MTLAVRVGMTETDSLEEAGELALVEAGVLTLLGAEGELGAAGAELGGGTNGAVVEEVVQGVVGA
jgi:hypothetical protein